MLILLPIFIFSVFQATILSWNIVLLIVVGGGLLRPPKESLLTAFFSGLIFDLTLGKTLGLTSIIFLLLTFLAILYQRKFKTTHPLYLLAFAFFSLWFFALLTGEIFALKTSLFPTFLILVVVAIFQWLDQRRKKL